MFCLRLLGYSFSGDDELKSFWLSYCRAATRWRVAHGLGFILSIRSVRGVQEHAVRSGGVHMVKPDVWNLFVSEPGHALP